VDQLTRWFSEALQSSDVRKKLAAQGFLPVAMCGADFAAAIRKQYENYGRIVREAKIGAE
jgi:tripartite-type tricarboxylate transporter receptor subunit TctC